MKAKFTFSILAAALLAALQSAQANDAPQKWQKKALNLVKEEPKVLDAKWRDTQTNVLWVAMEPDGTPRDGFAQMLCMTFIKAGAPEGDLKTIWIYDRRGFADGGQKAMGMAACR